MRGVPRSVISLSFDEGERWRVTPIDTFPVFAFPLLLGSASRLYLVCFLEEGEGVKGGCSAGTHSSIFRFISLGRVALLSCVATTPSVAFLTARCTFYCHAPGRRGMRSGHW